MSFQTTTLKVASVLFVFFLAVIGVLLYRAQSSVLFPPEYAECPDFWTVTGENKCKNEMSGPYANGPSGMTADFSGDHYSGNVGLKRKCEWAKSHNVVWDQITDKACANFVNSVESS